MYVLWMRSAALLENSSPASQLAQVFDKCEGGGELTAGTAVAVDGQVKSAYMKTLWDLFTASSWDLSASGISVLIG